ncbi:MAG: LysM peptidoglycan-binding domain-containing protein [Candidatus Omnitrophota bacterium]|nr:LysM peptidoglycan-binding domain-containing protein [Candidatus Omnitrophota bacterium]
MKQALKIILCLVLSVILSGCIVRAYKQVREREDQIISGNRGYLQGTPPPQEAKSAKTRETFVVEIELRNPVTLEVGKPKEMKPVEFKTIEGNKGYIAGEEILSEEMPSQEEAQAPKETLTPYTVKKDDTLQKISKQFYGTVKKWNKIYQANKNKIKDPNRIRSGITINIPQE